MAPQDSAGRSHLFRSLGTEEWQVNPLSKRHTDQARVSSLPDRQVAWAKPRLRLRLWPPFESVGSRFSHSNAARTSSTAGITPEFAGVHRETWTAGCFPPTRTARFFLAQPRKPIYA